MCEVVIEAKEPIEELFGEVVLLSIVKIIKRVEHSMPNETWFDKGIGKRLGGFLEVLLVNILKVIKKNLIVKEEIL